MPSASIAEAGKAQSLGGPDSARNGIWVQNNSDAALRLVEGGAEASASSGVIVPSGGYFETPQSRRAIGSWSVWGANAGQKFEWGVW